MREPVEFVRSMNTARHAIDGLGLLGLVVIGMKCGNFRPVITIETPTNAALLSAHPVIAVHDPVLGCRHLQVACYRACLVEWEAPAQIAYKSYKSYKSLDLSGVRLVSQAGGVA